MGNSLEQYRATLIDAEQKAEDDFDKTVLTLSGGSLGITFAFIKDIIGNKPVVDSALIFYAWLAWGVSISAVLLSYYFSGLALRKAIRQVDNGKIYKTQPGGWYDSATAILSAVSGLSFFTGVVLAALFAHLNL